MIKSLLIANRGEIACRIIRTARRMGIRTIAIYSQADAQALHVRMADEAHLVGPAPASESYLRTGRILAIAKQCGADAVHPGYGFLSENADFAELTQDAGMIFVGPPPSAIRAMGLKDKAKEIMSKAGVPVVPGYHGTNQDDTFLKRKAYEIGYPTLIKAVAGGGGKGMRKVAKALEFDDALAAARREAKNAFGNDDVLIERFVQSPRHIEVQIFGDSHGNVVHLNERDCSLQRRHQKVIEEAPAPGMSAQVRAAMGKAACEAARAVNYEGAGTVEFIVDGADGLSEDGFFFMEMNTRLQVEHPVTEMVTGIDLVEWQLRIAAGEKLPLAQDEISLQGHAFEARIYAEDVAAGFLPSTGTVIAAEFGTASAGLRVDAGVEAGDEISAYYDPMIAKLIVHGPDRVTALEQMHNALGNTVIAGPKTNIAFLSALCAHKGFAAGQFDTGLIDENIDTLVHGSMVDAPVLACGVAALLDQQSAHIVSNNASADNPWTARDAFQVAGERCISRDFLLDGKVENVAIRYQGATPLISQDGETFVDADGTCAFHRSGNRVYVLRDGHQWVFQPYEWELQAENGSHDGAVSVPMHGRIISVTVVDGDCVEAGDILFSVEAMKMEHAVLAPRDGVVRNLAIAIGDQAEDGAIAMQVEAPEGAEN